MHYDYTSFSFPGDSETGKNMQLVDRMHGKNWKMKPTA